MIRLARRIRERLLGGGSNDVRTDLGDRSVEDIDAMIDAYFDGELDGNGARFINHSVRHDAIFGDEFEKTESMLDEIRKPVAAPDLSESILSEVDRRRGWISPPLRNLVSAGRLAAAACFLVLLAGLYITERVSPGAFSLSPEPAPLTEVVQASSRQVEDRVANLAGAITEVQGCSEAPTACQSTMKRHFKVRSPDFDIEGTVRFTKDSFAEGTIVLQASRMKQPRKLVIEAGSDKGRLNSILMKFECDERQAVITNCAESMTPPPIVQDED